MNQDKLEEIVNKLISTMEEKLTSKVANFTDKFTEMITTQNKLIDKLDQLLTHHTSIGPIEINRPSVNHNLQLSKIWESNPFLDNKLQLRKIQYWKYLRSSKIAELYQTCLLEEPPRIPHKLRSNLNYTIDPKEKEIRTKAEVDKLKVEIDVLKLRQENQKKTTENIDQEVKLWIEEEFGINDSSKLILNSWEKKVDKEEQVSKNLWNKKEDFLIAELNKDRQDKDRGRNITDKPNQEDDWTLVNRRKPSNPWSKQRIDKVSTNNDNFIRYPHKKFNNNNY